MNSSRSPTAVSRQPHFRQLSIQDIKSSIDLLAYSQAATGAELSMPDVNGYRKLTGAGLGGLTVRPDGFYWHGRQVGGDALDFFALMLFDRVCRHLTKDEFRCVLAEAETWTAAPNSSTVRLAPSVRRHRATHHRVLEARPWTHVATHTYHNVDATPRFHVDRLERIVRRDDSPQVWRKQKRFRQWHTSTDGRRVFNLNGVTKVLYELPLIASAIAAGRRIWIVEGEKCADALNALFEPAVGGDVATTAPGGANHWRESYAAGLADAHVVVWGDADTVGQSHAHRVARSLQTHARCVQIITPDLVELEVACGR
jgi:hypothetical protein